MVKVLFFVKSQVGLTTEKISVGLTSWTDTGLLVHKTGFLLKPHIGLYKKPLLQIFIVNLGEKVFNKLG